MKIYLVLVFSFILSINQAVSQFDLDSILIHHICQNVTEDIFIETDSVVFKTLNNFNCSTIQLYNCREQPKKLSYKKGNVLYVADYVKIENISGYEEDISIEIVKNKLFGDLYKIKGELKFKVTKKIDFYEVRQINYNYDCVIFEGQKSSTRKE